MNVGIGGDDGHLVDDAATHVSKHYKTEEVMISVLC